MRRIAMLGAASSAAVALTVIGAPAAQANPAGDDLNLHSMEACSKRPGKSGFKFTLWYNSGQGGSWRNMRYPVYNFDVLRPGDGHSYPLRFCAGGASNPWPGSGQRVKNNAASGENFHYKYKARVYFKSGYKGAQDVMAPYQHIDQFRNVYNDNASFQFT
ncbi:hypothetical protein ACFW2D_16585 [Streptomyces sp. NPDC058914]|uniref:hypothetical protein n=1 Tax=Streptomyces TaxID=1883 RepID=UPI0036C6E2BF